MLKNYDYDSYYFGFIIATLLNVPTYAWVSNTDIVGAFAVAVVWSCLYVVFWRIFKYIFNIK